MSVKKDFSKMIKAGRFKDINLTDEKILLVLNYFAAMSEFYNRIPLKKVFEIISEQNDNSIPEEEFLKLADNVHDDGENFYFYILSYDEYYGEVTAKDPYDRDLLLESLVILDDEDYEEMIEAQADIPYYIPEKEELLKYLNEYYIELPKQFDKTVDFLIEEFNISRLRAKEVAEELIFEIHIADNDYETLFRSFARMGINFTKEKIEKFIPLLKELINNTRHAVYCGHTPNEVPEYTKEYEFDIDEIYNDSHDIFKTIANIRTTSLLNGNIPTNVIKEKTPDRNAPCPCGSGKKYKKCCGLK